MAALLLATLLAWLGAAIMILSDGRRGLAAGLSLAGLGLALGLAVHDRAAAAAVAAGAVAGALLGLRRGARGWRLMPPGSTPLVILSAICLVVGLAGGSLVAGPAAPARVAATTVILLSGARLMGAPRREAALAAAAALALAIGSLGAGAAAVMGAVAALGLNALPERPSIAAAEEARR
jgi:hypothetical protein